MLPSPNDPNAVYIFKNHDFAKRQGQLTEIRREGDKLVMTEMKVADWSGEARGIEWSPTLTPGKKESSGALFETSATGSVHENSYKRTEVMANGSSLSYSYTGEINSVSAEAVAGEFKDDGKRARGLHGEASFSAAKIVGEVEYHLPPVPLGEAYYTTTGGSLSAGLDAGVGVEAELSTKKIGLSLSEGAAVGFSISLPGSRLDGEALRVTERTPVLTPPLPILPTEIAPLP